MFTAYDVGRTENSNGEFPFGFENKRLAAELRALADLIESDQCIPQRVSQHTIARHDDFPMTTLVLRFYERQAPRAKEGDVA